MPDNNYGVLTEQGFVAGSGLGFNPIAESEIHPEDSQINEDEDDEV